MHKKYTNEEYAVVLYEHAVEKDLRYINVPKKCKGLLEELEKQQGKYSSIKILAR